MKKLDFTPYGDVKKNVHYLDRTIEFETGSFQVQRVGVKPITTFEVTYQGTGKQLKTLEDFYNEHRKSERFLFEYNGKEYTCQFTSDYVPTESFGFIRKNGMISRAIVKINVTLTLRVVNI